MGITGNVSNKTHVRRNAARKFTRPQFVILENPRRLDVDALGAIRPGGVVTEIRLADIVTESLIGQLAFPIAGMLAVDVDVDVVVVRIRYSLVLRRSWIFVTESPRVSSFPSPFRLAKGKG